MEVQLLTARKNKLFIQMIPLKYIDNKSLCLKDFSILLDIIIGFENVAIVILVIFLYVCLSESAHWKTSRKNNI